MRACCRLVLSLPLLPREVTPSVLKFFLLVVLGLWTCGVVRPEAAPTVTDVDASQPLSRIAFGSCNKTDKPQPVWEAVLQSAPQLWIWTGDIIYADTTDMTQMQRKYAQQKTQPAYQRLLETCPVIGVWDDHDYGWNNAGKEYPAKQQSQQQLLDFLDEPPGSPRRQQHGVYTSSTYGPPGRQVKVILLDTRYHRDLPGPHGDMLGAEQWQWLAQELQGSHAQLHLIVSSIQVLAKEHPYEKWHDFPRSRARLFTLIGKHQVRGVLFMSGDRHIGEMSRVSLPEVGYPLHEITASGLTHSWRSHRGEPNALRVGQVYTDLHYGFIVIDWHASPVTVELQLRDRHNTIQRRETLRLPDLSPSPSPKVLK